MGYGMNIDVSVSNYDDKLTFMINNVSSINAPKNNSVLFVGKKYSKCLENMLFVNCCLVFIDEGIEIEVELRKRHCFISCSNPRLEFCRFFEENNIFNLPLSDDYESVNGSLISATAEIGKNVTIMPFSVIGSGVRIGNDVYIGSGTKIISPTTIGNNVVIRENVVIGTDSLAFEQDANGRYIKFPQFGGVRIGNYVDIGANTVIGRGAVEDTIIGDNVKIDYSVFVAHNCVISDDTMLVGGTKIAGSTLIGKNVYVASASIINKVNIGDDAYIGWGSVVVRNVPAGQRMFGCPAKKIDI